MVTPKALSSCISFVWENWLLRWLFVSRYTVHNNKNQYWTTIMSAMTLTMDCCNQRMPERTQKYMHHYVTTVVGPPPKLQKRHGSLRLAFSSRTKPERGLARPDWNLRCPCLNTNRCQQHVSQNRSHLSATHGDSILLPKTNTISTTDIHMRPLTAAYASSSQRVLEWQCRSIFYNEQCPQSQSC